MGHVNHFHYLVLLCGFDKREPNYTSESMLFAEIINLLSRDSGVDRGPVHRLHLKSRARCLQSCNEGILDFPILVCERLKYVWGSIHGGHVGAQTGLLGGVYRLATLLKVHDSDDRILWKPKWSNQLRARGN